MDKDTANKYAGTPFMKKNTFQGIYYRAQYSPPFNIYLNISILNIQNILEIDFFFDSKMVDMKTERFHAFGLTGDVLGNPEYVSKMVKENIGEVFK